MNDTHLFHVAACGTHIVFYHRIILERIGSLFYDFLHRGRKKRKRHVASYPKKDARPQRIFVIVLDKVFDEIVPLFLQLVSFSYNFVLLLGSIRAVHNHAAFFVLYFRGAVVQRVLAQNEIVETVIQRCTFDGDARIIYPDRNVTLLKLDGDYFLVIHV